MDLPAEFLFEVEASATSVLEVGDTPYGRRRVVQLGGGTFSGPKLRGVLVPGGADWQVLRADGVLELTALYELQTDDGVLIHVTSKGIRHGPADILERITTEEVDPSLYYFRTTPVFEAPAGPYAWLNESVYVAVGERYPSRVRLRFYRIL
jgi:hypothetical protein